jgi:hypothetical protein
MLRTQRPDIERPFRIWLYPLPSLVALAGWMFLFFTANPEFLVFGLGTLAAGVAAFWFWQRSGAHRVDRTTSSKI